MINQGAKAPVGKVIAFASKNYLMKNLKGKTWLAAGIVAAVLAGSTVSAQTVLKDGSVMYPDGRRILKDGRVVYPDGTIRKQDDHVALPDGTVLFPGQERDRTDRRYRKNRTNLPPGQAKKVYGRSAKDYAPGQQKKWKKHKRDNDFNPNKANRKHRKHKRDDD